MTDQRLSGLVIVEAELPDRRRADRRGDDRRSGPDRRTVDLLRETGRPEHERRSGRDRRRDVRRPDIDGGTAPPPEIFMPWQLG